MKDFIDTYARSWENQHVVLGQVVKILITDFMNMYSCIEMSSLGKNIYFL